MLTEVQMLPVQVTTVIVRMTAVVVRMTAVVVRVTAVVVRLTAMVVQMATVQTVAKSLSDVVPMPMPSAIKKLYRVLGYPMLTTAPDGARCTGVCLVNFTFASHGLGALNLGLNPGSLVPDPCLCQHLGWI